MKVLVVSNMYPSKKYPSYGIFVSRFCKELEQIGIEVDCCAIKKTNNPFIKLIKYFYFCIKVFFRYIIKKYDCVYIHYASHSSLPIILGNKIKKNRIFVNVHGSDVVPENKKQEKMQKYTRKILKLSDRIIVPSEYFKEYVSKKYKCELNKIYVYPSGGVNTDLFYSYNKNDKLEFKKLYGITNDKIVVGYVGRISFGKGWDTFLNAVNMIDDKNYEFIIVGDGEYSSEMRKLIKKDNIKVYPLLNQDDLIKMYNCFDYFVFPTEREGESLGLVAIEAMACGIPVISSDFAAPKYYIKDEINGFKFKVKNVNDLKLCIEKLSMLSDEQKIQLKNNAIKTAQIFDSKSCRDCLKNIFEV